MFEEIQYEELFEESADDIGSPWTSIDNELAEDNQPKSAQQIHEKDEFAPTKVLFGDEPAEIEPNSCPGCDVEKGQEHEDGCELEVCIGCLELMQECSCHWE
ncbi:MAG: hypothetical protein FJ403_05905 [Verrucomicrobia bacterium]|nr:hypothetical protein [Verrucomicrobiota bacterium]